MANALEAASLVMIPSGYEDGTLGSLKPIDGSGDFTFTRGTDIGATRVAEDGYIEKGYENLLPQSNSFDTTWYLNTTSVTSGQSGYDNTTDAWLLNSTGTGFPRIQQNVSISGVFVFSVYAKAATDGFMLIRTNGANSQVWFDLSDGSVTNEEGSEYVSSTTEDVGNGWYRYSVIVNGNLTTVRIYPASAYGVYSTSGNGIYIQDAQINQGLVAMPYLPTTTTTSVGGILANQPRIDFTGGGCGSLLLEPSRTNELLYSEYFDGWQKISSPTITTNYGISPEGVQNSTRFQTSVGRLNQDVITINNNETFSVYMKGSGTLRIEIGSDNFFPSVTSEWVRYEFKTTQIGGNSSVQIRGNGSPVDVELYGAQYERNSYATSLIPTYGTSVTRAADVCGDAGNSSTFNDSEGVLYAEIAALADDSTHRFITLGDGTSQNEVRMAFENFGTSIISLRVIVGGTQQAFEWKQFLLPSILNYNKIAIVYAENRFELWVNGVKERSSSSGSTFPSSTLDRLDFKLVNGQLFYGKTKQVLTFNTALSDADLTALTTI